MGRAKKQGLLHWKGKHEMHRRWIWDVGILALLGALLVLTVALVHAAGSSAPAATTAPGSPAGSGACGQQGQGGMMGGGMMGNGGMMCNDPQPSSPSGTAQAGITQLTITSDAFQPISIQVPRGTTVTWLNHDTDTHTVTFVGAMMMGGMLAPDSAYQHTFTQVGTFEYYCMFHAGMIGWVTVTP
jgi:plastocyanin